MYSHVSLGRRALLAAACTAGTFPLCPRPTYAIDDATAKSPLIALLQTFLPNESMVAARDDDFESIAWNAPKRRGLSTERMTDAVNDGLREREWFVTGKGVPELFSNAFSFSDPDVSLDGIEPYCRQVRRLFDQATARCEVVCCSVTAPNTITVLWRNSGKVNVGPIKVDLKPYVVTTTLTTDPNDGNLIVSQTDNFEADGLGLLFYQIPFLRPFTVPAPSVQVLRQQCNFATCSLTE
ncbi:hypothetical protein AB1Y20_003824 [Prymnesium parvum]|uniref:Ig-like domain-containing protein n=1 Tax=Prymnesium parvum TaxID=97485 RepID=A0AB34J5W6_PRYPA